MLFLFNGNVSKYTKSIFVWTLSKLLCCRYTLLIILSDNVEVNRGRKCNTAQTPSINSYQKCSTKKDVLKNFTKFTGKQLRQSFFQKETLAQVFSWKFCDIFKNTFFTKYHFFYIICMSETYLHSSADDKSSEISRYYSIRSNQPSNKQCSSIYI